MDQLIKTDNEILNDIISFKARISYSLSNADCHTIIEVIQRGNDYYALVEYETDYNFYEVQCVIYLYKYNVEKYLLHILGHLDDVLPLSEILLDPIKYNLNISGCK